MEGNRVPIVPAVAVRLVALWILAGAALKLFLGTPLDLPQYLRHLPWEIGVTFRLLIAAETFVALFAMVRPRRGWPLEALLLIAFLVGLALQVSSGAASCGCFGSALPIPPAVMLAIDATLLVLLVLSRPWRLPATRLRRDLGFAAIALVLAVIGPLAVDREGTGVGPFRRYVVLEPDRWVGKALAETPLAGAVDLAQAVDGLWFFYRESCHVCANCLLKMTYDERRGERELTLLRLAPQAGEEGEHAVHTLPEGPWVHHVDLPPEYDLRPPAEMVVENGRIVSARELEPKDCE